MTATRRLAAILVADISAIRAEMLDTKHRRWCRSTPAARCRRGTALTSAANRRVYG